MYLGKLVELADSNELYNRPAHPYTQVLLSSIPVPDPRLAKTKIKTILEGDVPSPLNPPSGCKFRTRCKYATAKCAEIEPPMKDIGGGHMAACHLFD